MLSASTYGVGFPTLEQWPEDAADLAAEQGWQLSDMPQSPRGRLQVTRTDDSRLDSDLAAFAFVINTARAGSKFSQHAVGLLDMYNPMWAYERQFDVIAVLRARNEGEELAESLA